MKIVEIALFELDGELSIESEYWLDRPAYPIDIYESFRAEPFDVERRRADGVLPVSQIFLEVRTDEGVTGLAGPIDQDQADMITRHIAPLVVGLDPLATEYIWDLLHRAGMLLHGRREMSARAALDNALWDLKGKWFGQPVFRILGGPTRTSIPAYASTVGSSAEPEAAAIECAALRAEGYKAIKLFTRHGPGSGPAGMDKNVAQVAAARDAGQVTLMVDAWMSWDPQYTIEMARRLAPHGVSWIEEPLMAHQVEAMADLRRAVNGLGIRISAGEHYYDRWSIRRCLDAGAVDILQPDVLWAGGITEMVRIAAIASTYSVVVIPHSHEAHPTAHVIASQSPALFPQLEFMIRRNPISQYFMRHRLSPVDGAVPVSQLEQPGLGVELDESRIVARRELAGR